MPARHGQRLKAIDYPIDSSAPNCCDTPKALLIKRRLFNGGVSCVAVNTTFLLLRLTHHRNSIAKLPNSKSKKTNGVERKKIRQPNNFKSDVWYEKAVLSVTIKR